MSHFEEALKKIHPLSPQELNWYQRTVQEFGRNIVPSRRASEVTEGEFTDQLGEQSELTH